MAGITLRRVFKDLTFGLATGALLTLSWSEPRFPHVQIDVIEELDANLHYQDDTPGRELKFQYSWEASVKDKVVAGGAMTCREYKRLGDKRVAQTIFNDLEKNLSATYGEHWALRALLVVEPDLKSIAQVLISRCGRPQLA